MLILQITSEPTAASGQAEMANFVCGTGSASYLISHNAVITGKAFVRVLHFACMYALSIISRPGSVVQIRHNVNTA